MDNFVVIVFPDEEKAYEGRRALQNLHREGIVTVYETAVLQRGLDGTVSSTITGVLSTQSGGWGVHAVREAPDEFRRARSFLLRPREQ